MEANEPRVLQRDEHGKAILVDHGNGYITVGRERSLAQDFVASGERASDEPREPLKRVTPLSTESVERDEYGEVEIITREMSPACEQIIWAVLSEVAWQDADGLTNERWKNADEAEYIIMEAAWHVREAMRLSTEGA